MREINEKNCPYCRRKLKEKYDERNDLINCDYCGYTIENGVVTQKSNIENIKLAEKVLRACERVDRQIHKEGYSLDDISNVTYTLMVADELKEK